MPKRLYYINPYSNAMTADFLQQDQYPMHIFFESKDIVVEEKLEFRCSSSLNNMTKQDFIDSNAGSILISERLKKFLLGVLPVGSVQFIDSTLKCKDGVIDKLYLINSLMVDNIIDINNSKKKYISFSPGKFYLDNRPLA